MRSGVFVPLRFGLCVAAALSVGPAMLAAGPGAPAAATGLLAGASIFNVDPSLLVPVNSLRYQTDGVSSSTDAIDAERVNLSGESLSGGGSGSGLGSGPPPGARRRTYGRSRYEDRGHNADGSTKIAFMAGAGLNLPVGNTGKFYTPSYDIAVGAGYNFSKMFGVLGEFHYDHLGVTGGAINAEYQRLQSLGATNADLQGFDANAHIYAITVNPVVSYTPDNSKLGAYVTAGVGFYHKTTNFTLPTYGTVCDYFCYTYATNYNADTASANAFGANGGFGLTYKISSFSTERLFIEARYHWLNINSNNNTDVFPYNRRNSEYVPIVVGLRF